LTSARLELRREQILTHRRAVGALDRRLPAGTESLRRAAWAGLQDSVPRAAVLSIHARVEGTRPETWEDPSLIQLWGPRYSVYVVAATDHAVFSLGRLPDHGAGRQRAEDLAGRLHAFLDGRRLGCTEVGHSLGVHPNSFRYGAATGTVLIRWDGARQPPVWTVPAPDVDPREARLELARRYLHVFGPATPTGFAEWAGIRPTSAGRAAFDALAESLTPVQTPAGDAWILTGDEPSFRAPGAPAAPARLLPSGDAYTLLARRRSGAPGPRRGRPPPALDPASLARRRSRRRRDRRDVAALAGRSHGRAVAPPIRRGTRGGRGRSCLLAAARDPGERASQVGRVRTPLVPGQVST
jgi:hypothetical protein